MAGQKANGIIEAVKAIIDQYGGQKLTIRQIYYRLVAAQVIKNDPNSYNGLVKVLSQARKDGAIPYSDIEDRTRTIKEGHREAWDTREAFNAYLNQFKGLASVYSMPRWWGQPKRVIIMVEKQALEGIFADICTSRQVDLMVCRGYPSVTQLNAMAERLQDVQEEIVITYFGDYDPSGLDIERDVEETLGGHFGIQFSFSRMAITKAQIDQYGFIPAPAKVGDSRTKGMEEKHGEAMQVELDAIEPRQLKQMIEGSIDRHFDQAIFSKRNQELARRRELIQGWVDSAIDPDFELPEDEDEDEDEDDQDDEEQED